MPASRLTSSPFFVQAALEHLESIIDYGPYGKAQDGHGENAAGRSVNGGEAGEVEENVHADAAQPR
jgi:hypothetical protein